MNGCVTLTFKCSNCLSIQCVLLSIVLLELEKPVKLQLSLNYTFLIPNGVICSCFHTKIDAYLSASTSHMRNTL